MDRGGSLSPLLARADKILLALAYHLMADRTDIPALALARGDTDAARANDFGTVEALILLESVLGLLTPDLCVVANRVLEPEDIIRFTPKGMSLVRPIADRLREGGMVNTILGGNEELERILERRSQCIGHLSSGDESCRIIDLAQGATEDERARDRDLIGALLLLEGIEQLITVHPCVLDRLTTEHEVSLTPKGQATIRSPVLAKTGQWWGAFDPVELIDGRAGR